MEHYNVFGKLVVSVTTQFGQKLLNKYPNRLLHLFCSGQLLYLAFTFLNAIEDGGCIGAGKSIKHQAMLPALQLRLILKLQSECQVKTSIHQIIAS